MSRRAGTASPSKRQPPTLDSYIQAAIVANSPESQSAPQKSRTRRKKQQQEASIPLPNALKVDPAAPAVSAKPKRRKRKSKFKHGSLQQRESSNCSKIRVRGLVTAEELEDDDEAEEVREEVRADFSRFGELLNVAIVQDEEDRDVDVVVTFQHAKDAASAFTAFNGNVFGGRTVTCVWELQSAEDKVEGCVVEVDGMLTPEELEDPDEVTDVQEEMRQIFSKHGKVNELHLNGTSGQISVIFNDNCDAQKAVQVMNGSQYGGSLVTARVVCGGAGDGNGVGSARREVDAETQRVSTYIVQPTKSLELQTMVGTFLKRLAALQERAHTRNPRNDKRLRRVVLGMHEVRRGLLANKIRLLVIATDLDGCEALAETHVELVAIAREKEVPVLAPMNRRKLGRVLQKSVRVSCVGVYSAEGANELFQQILQAMNSKLSVK
ncbi:hypothetical protein PRNP1_001994 [Phytophthora ramorum]